MINEASTVSFPFFLFRTGEEDGETEGETDDLPTKVLCLRLLQLSWLHAIWTVWIFL